MTTSVMTTSQILAKIEGGLGYVELGHKSIDERVSVILAEINKIQKPPIRQAELVEKLDCEEHLDGLSNVKELGTNMPKIEIGQIYNREFQGGSYMVLDIVVRESGTRQGKWVTKIIVSDGLGKRHAISLRDFGRDILQEALILQR